MRWSLFNAVANHDSKFTLNLLEKFKNYRPEILQQILFSPRDDANGWNLAHCAILNEMPEILNKIAEIADDKVVVKLLNTPNKAAQYPMQLNDVTNGLIKFLMSKPLDSIYFQPIFAEGNTLLHFIDPNIFKNLDPENVTSAQIAFMNLIHKMPNPDEFLSVKNAAGETVYDKIDGLKEYVTEMKTRDFSWIDQCPKRDLNDIVREIQAKEACPHLTAGHIGKIVTSDSKALWAEHSGQNIGYLGLGH